MIELYRKEKDVGLCSESKMSDKDILHHMKEFYSA